MFPRSCLPSVPPRIAAPAPTWADPSMLLAGSSWRVTPASLIGNTVGQVARIDPKRIAIGFGFGTQAVFQMAFGPTSRPDIHGFQYNQTFATLWFTVFEHGPLVNSDWFGFSSGNVSFGVIEVYRLS